MIPRRICRRRCQSDAALQQLTAADAHRTECPAHARGSAPCQFATHNRSPRQARWFRQLPGCRLQIFAVVRHRCCVRSSPDQSYRRPPKMAASRPEYQPVPTTHQRHLAHIIYAPKTHKNQPPAPVHRPAYGQHPDSRQPPARHRQPAHVWQFPPPETPFPKHSTHAGSI